MLDDELVSYSFEIVGGPYDGAPGLYWLDDGEHPVPDEIFLGRCPGNASCGNERCRRRAHVAYWTASEFEAPVRVLRYEKEDDHVRRVESELAGADTFVGSARYVFGGLDFLARRQACEMVPAGAAS